MKDEFDLKLLMENYENRVKEYKELGLDEVNIDKEIRKIFTEEEMNYIQSEMQKRMIARSQIILPTLDRPMSQFAEELGRFFTNRTDLFFRPVSKDVVRLDTVSPEEGEMEKIEVFQKVKSSEFVTFIERYFIVGENHWVQGQSREVFREKSMGKNTADIILESIQFKEKLPVIDKIFNVPYPILKNGILSFPKRGYDVEFKSWIPFESPAINVELPFEEAKKIVEELFKEFCFKDPLQDKVNAIAGLLTPFCRMLYENRTSRTPIFFYKANRERSGKDYLAGITSIVYDGMASEETPIATGKDNENEEFRKKISSAFIRGRMRIHSSNNKGYINSSILEMLATSQIWSDRLLGSNNMLEFPNMMEISLSANTGITYTPDLSKRCIFVNLFLDIEDPNERRFEKPDLHKWVRENRSLVLSSLFAFVKNWYDKGMPSGTTPFASYPEWARVVGGIMDSAGYSTPCITNDDAESVGGDTETREMKKLFELAYEKWGSEWVEKREVMTEMKNPESDFGDISLGIKWEDEKSASTRFNTKLLRFVGRVFSGIKLEVERHSNSGRNRYRWVLIGGERWVLIGGEQKNLNQIQEDKKVGNCYKCGMETINQTTDMITKEKIWVCEKCALGESGNSTI